jgi:hypothetical protein
MELITRQATSGWTGRYSPRFSIRLTTASSTEFLGQDGDPLDALVMITEPTLIKCRTIAIFHEGQGGRQQ